MRRITLLLTIIISGLCSAQNTPRFSQFNFAQGVNNPSAIAVDGALMVDFIFRNQWLGVEGAPTTFALNGQYELSQDFAIGMTFFHDRIGVDQTNSFAAQYAYRLYFENSNFLALGVGIGLDNVINNLASTVTTTPNDPAFVSSASRVYLNGNFGIYYHSPKFYIGASIPKLFQNNRYSTEPGFVPPRWHYYISTGFKFQVGDGFTFNPQIQLKTALNTPIQGDLILRNTFNNQFSIVVGYRSENSIIAGFDVNIKSNARIGYSFNYDVGDLARIKGMSNELYLGLAFPYRTDKENFGSRKYLGRKGTHKSDFRKNSRRRQKNRGARYGRNSKTRH